MAGSIFLHASTRVLIADISALVIAPEKSTIKGDWRQSHFDTNKRVLRNPVIAEEGGVHG
jgi:hypothetical protein